MYCYYEHHRDAHGKIVLTELRISSYGGGSLSINFRNPLNKLQFDLCVKVLKFPDVAQRSYDEASKSWSYMGDWGTQVIDRMRTVVEGARGEFHAIEVEDLVNQCIAGRIYLDKKKKVRPEDFFYNHGSVAAVQPLSKEQIAVKLATYFCIKATAMPSDTQILKRLYRQAALRLHPDRNNGDGTQMSDLNMYWGLYNATTQ